MNRIVSFISFSTGPRTKTRLDYDQYYATLAASSASSTLDTPSGLSAPGGSDFGLDDEEEEKPAVEYLDSLNDYRKRSRSREDEGIVGQTKMAKVEAYANGNGNGFLGVNGYGQQDDVNMTTPVDVELAYDPIVYGTFHCWLVFGIV